MLPLVLGVLALGATGASLYQAHRAQDAAEEENKLARQRQRFEEARNIRRAVAQSRVLQARAQAAGAVTGTSESSGTFGAISSEAASTAGNIGYARTIGQFQQATFAAQADRTRATYRSQQFSALGNLFAAGTGMGDTTGAMVGNYLASFYN